MTKKELKELIKEVISEARYSASDKQFVSKWANEGNKYIEGFIYDLYNKKKNDITSYFKTVKIPKIKAEIKSQVKIGDYNKSAKLKEFLQTVEGSLKDPIIGRMSIETYIKSWIWEKYPDFTALFKGGDFGASTRLGYTLKSMANQDNTTMEKLEDEFVEWYKENFKGDRSRF